MRRILKQIISAIRPIRANTLPVTVGPTCNAVYGSSNGPVMQFVNIVSAYSHIHCASVCELCSCTSRCICHQHEHEESRINECEMHTTKLLEFDQHQNPRCPTNSHLVINAKWSSCASACPSTILHLLRCTIWRGTNEATKRPKYEIKIEKQTEDTEPYVCFMDSADIRLRYAKQQNQ